MNGIAFFLVFFIVMVPVSLLVHRFFVIRAERYFIKKINTSAERWASQTKPILGGIGFFAAFLISTILFILINKVPGNFQLQFIGIVLSVTISFLMGLADDRLNTPPGFKFGMQLIVSLILIFTGVSIHVFSNQWINYGLTIFWVVAIMNSLNMLDNMDAITTTVSITILLGIIALLFLKTKNTALLYLGIGSLASFFSFLYYNWNPSKMYMGDNGSQFVGSLLAILSIETLWNTNPIADGNWLYHFLVVFLVFLVPISDTTTVTINRLMRGQSPFVGGRDHTTHHLSYFGLSDRKVAITLFSINGLSAFSAVFIILNPPKTGAVLWVLGLIALIILVSLYSITKISKPKPK